MKKGKAKVSRTPANVRAVAAALRKLSSSRDGYGDPTFPKSAGVTLDTLADLLVGPEDDSVSPL